MRMTPKNVMPAEAKISPITFQLKFPGSSYLTRAHSKPNHLVIWSLHQLARVQEDPIKLLRGKVPWIYTCCVDTELVGHLITKDARPLECRFSYQTLLVKGTVSFKEGEEAKAIPNCSNRLNENIKDLQKEADGSKMCNQEFVGFSCVTASGEIRHQCRTTKFASIFKGEAVAIFENVRDN
jgi:hypothetical protein